MGGPSSSKNSKVPKPQAYPDRSMREGTVLYCADTVTHRGKTTVVFQEWHVRTIQVKRGSNSRFGVQGLGTRSKTLFVNLAQKVEGVTWGKRSKTQGDFGWKSSVPAEYRKQFQAGHALPSGLYTTKYAALRFAVPDFRQTIAFCQESLEEETDPELLAEIREDMLLFQEGLLVLERRLKAMQRELRSERARSSTLDKPLDKETEQ